ncbi:MAG TPA: LD-carboxypeptidase [Thermoanaerobaculia bacterium]|jgi:muramoyltetrapeptide carboxypeptidase|nr:LD-carboxypeptidase [Thermoanaerobaculia bacterium]
MFHRRDFAKLTLLAAPTLLAQTAPAKRATLPILKPKKLVEGDTVGMIVPATMVFETDFIDRGREQLEALGFRVKLGAHVKARYGNLAGTDRERAADINGFFADNDVKAVIAFSGGWGTPRLLPYLDYDLIRRNPKVLLGFSDITGLLNAVHKKTGLVTFHGPNADSKYEPYTLGNFRKVIMNADPIGTLPHPPKRDDELIDRDNRVIVLREGVATGRLVGGNLTLIASTMGTPYEIDTDGAILFLEDTHEELYRIDRMLTQLWLAGKFDRLAGFVFGRCTDCPIEGPALSMGELLRERFGHVPSVWGLSFGHIEKKLTLPIGVQATLDATAKTLTIAESAVV